MSEKPAGKQGGKKGKKGTTLSLQAFLQEDVDANVSSWADDEDSNPFESNPQYKFLAENAAAQVTVWDKPPYTLKSKGFNANSFEPFDDDGKDQFQETIRAFFGAEEVRAVCDKATGEFRGTVFLEFSDIHSAQKAREKRTYQGASLRNEPIKSSDKPKSKRGAQNGNWRDGGQEDRPPRKTREQIDPESLNFRNKPREEVPLMKTGPGALRGDKEPRKAPDATLLDFRNREVEVVPASSSPKEAGFRNREERKETTPYDFRNQDSIPQPKAPAPQWDNLRSQEREAQPTVVRDLNFRSAEPAEQPPPPRDTTGLDFRNQAAPVVVPTPVPSRRDGPRGEARGESRGEGLTSSGAASGLDFRRREDDTPAQPTPARASKEGWGALRNKDDPPQVTPAPEAAPTAPKEATEASGSRQRFARGDPSGLDFRSGGGPANGAAKEAAPKEDSWARGSRKQPSQPKPTPANEVSFGRGKTVEPIKWDA